MDGSTSFDRLSRGEENESPLTFFQCPWSYDRATGRHYPNKLEVYKDKGNIKPLTLQTRVTWEEAEP